MMDNNNNGQNNNVPTQQIIGTSGNDTLFGDSNAENLLINGALEDVGHNSRVSMNGNLEGWQSDTGIEVWADGFGGITTEDQGDFVEMDRNANSFDNLYQDVTTKAGAEYIVNFDSIARPGSSGETVEVFWNGELVGSADPQSSESWANNSFTVTGTGGSDRLEFRELVSEDNGLGPLLNDISLVSVESYDDTIVGGHGNDSIFGGEGDDVITGSGSDTPNLINNGGLENFVHRADAGWGAQADSIDGWTVTGTTPYVEMVDDSHRGAEGEGDYSLDLETHSGHTLTLSQEVEGLVDGQSYELSFKASQGTSDYNNEVMQVFWNGELVLEANPEDSTFETFKVDLIAGSGDGSNTLSVTTAGNLDAYGIYVDDFQMVSTEDHDTIHGGAGDDVIDGGAGNDNLFGGNDDDVMSGDNGDDGLWGGTGNDTMSGGEGNDQLFGEDGDDQIDAGLGDDRAFGGAGDDVINGGEGNDELGGENGNDTIDAGAGNDRVYGGEGHDAIDGGAGDDELIGDGGNDQIDAGSGNDRAFGGNGDDVINGGAGDDEIGGDEGNDTLSGGEGNDRIYGGNGDDAIDGGNGSDQLFAGEGNDVIDGGRGNDMIYAGGGDDRVEGGAGHDMLWGQQGADTYSGGAGNDTFFLDGFDGQTDTIELATADLGGQDMVHGFAQGEDEIDLSALGNFQYSDGGLAGGGQQSVTFANGVLSVDADGDGQSDLDMMFSGVQSMSDTDFVF